MNDFSTETYFVDGGTLRANTPSYVKRPADDELFEALLNREYCYVLTPRQMGKSSLMIRTSQRLKERNIQSAVVDIQGIGTSKIREWYASLLSRIRRGLRLNIDVDEWMAKKSSVGFGQMFSDFIQDVVLTEIAGPVVIFLDEVDWMIKIDFRDDFFASIRSMYNARADFPEFDRISFVLLGVASPADLISEPTRTPFNIGHSIPLQELSFEDAVPLQDGLEKVCPGEGEAILRRIFYWTNGHPYLTQKLCKTIAEGGKDEWPDVKVDELVDSLFLAEESRKEANLKFIQDRILSNSQFAQMLSLYKRVRRTRIRESGQSVTQNQLMLSGLLTSRGEYLEVRNRIYHTVFNDRWISRNMPKNWQRVTLLSLGAVTAFLLAIFIYDFSVGMRVDGYTAEFVKASSPAIRLSQLARFYHQRGGVVSNKNLRVDASQLFYTLQAKDQISLFTEYGIDQNPAMQDDLVVVISNLYITLAYVDPNNDNTLLLQTMRKSLDKVKNNPDSKELKAEIDLWLDGRKAYLNKDYTTALTKYNEAIGLTPNNPATVYERALVYIALGNEQSDSKNYAKALVDLDTTIRLAKQTTQQDEIDLTPEVTDTSISSTETVAAPSTSQDSGANQGITLPTQSPQTPRPSGTVTPTQEQSPVLTYTPTQPATPTIAPTLMPSPTPQIDKFESNFTTFLEIYSAIRTLIDKTSALRQSINGMKDSYPNLDSIGLVDIYSTTPTATFESPLGDNEVTELGGANQIAFVANNEIWLMNMDGSNLSQITSDGATKNDLQWLDGDTLLFLSGKVIKYYKVSTGVVDILTSFNSAVSLDAFQVSHDGTQVMIAMSNEIFVVPFDIEHMKTITSRNTFFQPEEKACILPTGGTKAALAVHEARWSKDDKLVAWLYRGVSGNTQVAADQIMVLDVTSCDPTKIIQEDNFPGERFVPVGYQTGILPDFDWDGNDQFSFNTLIRNDGWGELYLYNWITHKPTQIDPINNACCYRDARWSPDGTYLFFEFQDLSLGDSAQTQMFYVPVDELTTGANFKPIPLPDGFFKNPREAAQVALRSTLTILSNSKSTSTLTITPTLEPTGIATPNGGAAQFAVLSGNNIFAMNLDGSNPKVVDSENFEKSNLQWIIDDRLVYISPVHNCAYVLDLKNKAPATQLCYTQSQKLEGFRVSPDGNYVAISIDRVLYVVPFDVEQLKTVSTRFLLPRMKGACSYSQPIKDVRWSRDGKHIAALTVDTQQGASDQIYLFDVDPSQCNSSLLVPTDKFPAFHFSIGSTAIPSYDWDGNHLFLLNDFKLNNGFGDLYLYDSETQTGKVINPINGACCYRDAHWSPDGRYILFLYQSGTTNAIEIYYISLADLDSGKTLIPIQLAPDLLAPDLFQPRDAPELVLRPIQ